MANPIELVLGTLTEMKQDFRDHREETKQQFEKIMTKQDEHQEYITSQKARIDVFKWVAGIGGLTGVSSLFKSFLG